MHFSLCSSVASFCEFLRLVSKVGFSLAHDTRNSTLLVNVRKEFGVYILGESELPSPLSQQLADTGGSLIKPFLVDAAMNLLQKVANLTGRNNIRRRNWLIFWTNRCLLKSCH
jgi:hypothetical protein